mmetsp:Transcript_60640/g.100247  ORF Transcript_60640/g.100247 Transcript_60640/m.100247 type:complete len:222 (-) Transcript_60640:411-1076(-)
MLIAGRGAGLGVGPARRPVGLGGLLVRPFAVQLGPNLIQDLGARPEHRDALLEQRDLPHEGVERGQGGLGVLLLHLLLALSNQLLGPLRRLAAFGKALRIRALLHPRVIRGHALCEVAHPQQHLRFAAVRLGIGGLHVDGLLTVLQGLVQLPQLHPCLSPVAQSPRVLGDGVQGLGVALDGLIVLALVELGGALRVVEVRCQEVPRAHLGALQCGGGRGRP